MTLTVVAVLLIIMSGVGVPLHAQETAAEETPQQETETTETSSESQGNGTSAYSNSYDADLPDSEDEPNIIRYDIFFPSFPELEETLRDADQRYFEKILKNLNQIKSDLNSTYISLQDQKTQLDRKSTLGGTRFYQADILLKTNYYKYISPVIRTNYYLEKSVNLLEQLEANLNRRILAFEADIEEAMINQVTYELKTLLGVAYTLRGGRKDLILASQQFEFLLGKNPVAKIYLADDDTKRRAYYYLAGIYDRLSALAYYRDFNEARLHAQKKLFYLWNLVVLNTPDNEKLKDVKLQDLANRYVSIMNLQGVNFKDLYEPYVENILAQLKNAEAIAEESPEPKDITGSESQAGSEDASSSDSQTEAAPETTPTSN